VAATAFLAPVSGDGDHQSDQRRIGSRVTLVRDRIKGADGTSNRVSVTENAETS
jgi:hypothetical protein